MYRALIILPLALAPSLAHADPVAIHAAALEEAPPVYIAPGAVLGYANDHAVAGPSIEIGTRFRHNFVLYGNLLSATNAFVAAPGSLKMATVGVDLTSCESVERVCVYVGGAVGYERDTHVDDVPSADAMTVTRESPQALARAGADIGGKHLRLRYGPEVGLVSGRLEAALTASVAFRF